jgi:hypothetical protein
MIKNKQNDLTIFSKAQLSFFAKEIQEAGGFDELMITKKAIVRSDGRTEIFTYKNIPMYRATHLIGVYKSLRPFFNTKVPYSFWSQLYIAIKGNTVSSQ